MLDRRVQNVQEELAVMARDMGASLKSGLFGSPYNKDYNIFGSVMGSTYSLNPRLWGNAREFFSIVLARRRLNPD